MDVKNEKWPEVECLPFDVLTPAQQAVIEREWPHDNPLLFVYAMEGMELLWRDSIAE